MVRKRRWLKVWTNSLLMALSMVFLTFYWISRPYIFGDEAFLIKWSVLVKKSLLGIDPKPAPADILLVDVAKSKTTIQGENEFGESSPHFTEVITNRAELAKFLKLIRQYNPDVQLIVCDIMMDKPSPADSILQLEVNSLQDRILLVSHLDQGKHLIQSVIQGPEAIATYRATQNLFLKYPLLYGDSLKTIPLVMFELLDGATFRHWGPFYRLNGQLSFQAPVVDFQLRPADFASPSDQLAGSYSYLDIGSLIEASMNLEKSHLHELFRSKVVIIGDYSNDMHNTPLGQMPGSLLILNAYLSLANGYFAITTTWLIFIYLSFYLISYRIFTEKKISPPRWLRPLFDSKLGRIILDGLDEAFLLSVITIISYFTFHIHVNILFLLVYIKVIEYFWKRFRRPKTIQ